MGCIIAGKINDGKLTSLEHKVVKNFGAGAMIATATVTTTDGIESEMTTSKTERAFTTKYKRKVSTNKVAENYIFTGTDFNTNRGKQLSRYARNVNELFPDGMSINNEESIKAVEDVFLSKDKIISAETRNRNGQVIISSSNEIPDADAIGVITLTQKDVDRVASTSSAVKGKSGALQFLVMSALHRGFDVVIPSNMGIENVTKAAALYNKTAERQADIVTTLDINGIERIGNISEHFNGVSKPFNKAKKVTPYTDNDLLNEFLTEGERTAVNKRKFVAKHHKIAVLKPLVKVFKKVAPGVDFKMMTTNEIIDTYGREFADQMGFMVDGKIHINLDLFDSETVFHEFSHFFFKWMKNAFPEQYANILQVAGTSNNAYNIREKYRKAGLQMSEEEILEEIAVTEIGMNAGNEFETLLENANSPADVSKLAEKFAYDFTAKLLGMVNPKNSIGMYDSVLDIYSFQSKFQGVNTSLMYDNHKARKSFSTFSFPKASLKDAFNGMTRNGMIKIVPIRGSKGHRVFLFDKFGNSVNKFGKKTSDKGSVGTYYPDTDSARQRTNNKNLLLEISPFINTSLDLFDVRFQTPYKTDPTQIYDDLMSNSEGIKLNADETKYVLNGHEFTRATSFIDEAFGEEADESKYVAALVYTTLLKQYTKTLEMQGTLTDEDIKAKAAAMVATSFRNPTTDTAFKKAKADAESIFEIKRNEGTLLHGVAELVIRAFNITQSDNFNANGFSIKDIADKFGSAVSSNDREGLRKYLLNEILGNVKDKSTKEVKQFETNIEEIVDNIIPRDARRIDHFLQQLVISLNRDIIGQLEGPLTFIPELKVSSKTLGVAGTIDLLVIDKNGVGHVYDYKTKEEGKEKNWAYPSEIMFRGTMGAYNSNARMKASIQTSLYAVILNEIGIKTQDSAVLYVSGKMSSTQEETDSDKRLRYDVQEIKMVDLTNVTGEIQRHFIDLGIIPNTTDTFGGSIIDDVITKASGHTDLTIQSELREVAQKVYDRALNDNNEDEGDDGLDRNAVMALFGGGGGVGAVSSDKGLKVRLPGGVIHYIPTSITSEEDSIDYLSNIMKKGFSDSKHEDDFMRIFAGGEVKNLSKKKKEEYRALQRGTSSATHRIVKMSSDMNMGEQFSGITMIENKLTGSNRVVVYNNDHDAYLPFGKGDRDHRTVFGNYLTNARVKQIFPKNMWENTAHSMRLLKAGMGIMAMKKKNPDFTMEYIVTNTKDSKHGVTRMEDLSTILKMVTTLVDAMVDAGEDVPQELIDMTKDEKLTQAKNYIANPIRALGDFLGNTHSSGVVLPESNIFRTPGNSEARTEMEDAAREITMNPNIGYSRMMKALSDFRHVLGFTLTTMEDKKNSLLWKLTDDAILHLNNFNPNLIIKDPTFIQKLLTTASGSSNTEQSTFNRATQAAGVAIRHEFMSYKKEMNKIINDLKKLHGISDFNTRVNFGNKRIFENLYKTTNKDKKTAFVLKSPNEVSEPAEKAALKFFHKVFEAQTKESVHGERVIPEGWMPLMTKSKLSTQADESNPLKMAKTFVMGVRKNRKSFENDTTQDPTDDMYFITENPFKSQIPKEGMKGDLQWTASRRSKLGLDEFGNTTQTGEEKDLSMIEDNLENVMDAFVMGSLEAKYYEPVSMFGSAILMNINRFEGISKKNLNNAKEIVTIIQRKVINNETAEKMPETFKFINKFTTTAIISGSVAQILLETFTNPMVTGTNYMADKIYGTMFKGQRQFSAASYARATQIMFNPTNSKERRLVEEIDKLYGITTSDNNEIKKQMSMLEGNALFSSEKLMYVNKFMLDSWQRITLAAWLIEKGSLNAYSLDEYGNLEYDEKRDQRFIDDKELKKAIKKRLLNTPGALKGKYSEDLETRELNWGLAPDERNYIKGIIQEVYASMDEESKSLATFYTGSALMSKMRAWIFPKMPRYFKQPMTKDQNESQSRLKKIINPDGTHTYEWEGTASEGIAFSAIALYNGVVDQGIVKGYKNGYNLEEHQKENMSKLMGDMGMWLFLMGTGLGVWAYLIDDEDKKDPVLALIHKRYMAATADTFLPGSLIQMAAGQGSMLISASVVARAFTSGVTALGSLATIGGENGVEELGVDVNNFFRSSLGIYKSGELVFDKVNME